MYDKCRDDYQISLGISSLIGTRKEQQDSVYGEILDDSTVVILCDGMGGLQNGAEVSQRAISIFAEQYENKSKDIPVMDFLKDIVYLINDEICLMKHENKSTVDMGTTLASVVIKDRKLYYIEVGDSNIYVLRDGNIRLLNRHHNYRLKLDYQLKTNQITQEEYEKKEKDADALISYIGIEPLKLIDICTEPIELKKGDIVIVCSDGLYNTLSDTQIVDICIDNLPDTQKAADALTKTAIISSLDNQDNTSVAIVQYR